MSKKAKEVLQYLIQSDFPEFNRELLITKIAMICTYTGCDEQTAKEAIDRFYWFSETFKD